MKLYMTIEDEEGLKVERVIRVDEERVREHVGDIVESMIDSLKEVKEEETINEARRLVNNDKAIS